jgi:hypothetical protein
MSSIHNMSSIFTKYEQQGLKKTVEKSKKLWNTTLDPSLHFGSANHECSFKLIFFILNQLAFPPKWSHVS